MSLTQKSSYYYSLPEELIAQYPLEERTSSRLMLVDRRKKAINHLQFKSIADYLYPGDVLVLNRTKVIPARLFGINSTGAQVEVFLLTPAQDDCWQCLVFPGKKAKPGQKITFSPDFSCEIQEITAEGNRLAKFYYPHDFWQALEKHGKTPLPPYIKREAAVADLTAYQTVYAEKKGSVAAPTAGLHFTPDLLNEIKNKGIIIAGVVLHVGLGTFRPVKSENILDHVMHQEYCEITKDSARIINAAKKDGRRVIAVGTTSCRTLESCCEKGLVTAGAKWTDLFIYPGKELQIIDGLITNFHMPESTLLMLVSAFGGYDLMMQAYRKAVEERYRFFSYGDAMFIY